MFKHLCLPKTGVIFVPYPSLFSTNSATEPVVKELCSFLQPIYSWPQRGKCGGWVMPMVRPAAIHALYRPLRVREGPVTRI